MASTYSTDLKLELMATGENAGTWGTKTNSNLNLLQQAIAGVQGIDVSAADVTLAMTNAQISNARNMVLVLNGSLTGNRQVLVPNGIEKFYIIHDQTVRNGYSLTIKTVSGTGYAVETTAGSSDMSACYSDGTDVYEISLNTLSGSIATAQLDNLAVTSAKLASFAVTSARVASYAITASRLATNAVTAIKITQSTITQAKLAANSVGANQLISTGVTAATYTAATITVDADGRITSASSGSGGAGMGIPVLAKKGPASGTYTANANANRIGVYILGGGGGFGYYYSMDGVSTNQGGSGGYGFWNVPITQPYSKTYSVGAAGNNPNTIPGGGGAGGTTNLTNVGTANGGNAGMGSSGANGNAGNAPGSSLAPDSRNFVVGGFYSLGAKMSTYYNIGMSAGDEATSGAGFLAVFENTGT